MCAAKAPVILVWDFRGFSRLWGHEIGRRGKNGTRLAYYSVREMISLRGIRELLDETGCLLPPEIDQDY